MGLLEKMGTEEDLFRTSEEHNLQYVVHNSSTDVESLHNCDWAASNNIQVPLW